MSDARLTPVNARVADAALRGSVEGVTFTEGTQARITRGIVDLAAEPGGPRTRQLLLGAPVTCYEVRDGQAFIRAEDGYVGYLPAAGLGAAPDPTHWVCARASHSYTAPDLKSAETAALVHLSRLAVLGRSGTWAQTPLGHVPLQHLAPLPMQQADPVTAAELYLGTPYLWGGNSAFGIDCSGLVQAGCRACGIACPGDSDLQEAALGTPLDEGQALRRGDLIFWRGHVAWMLDGAHILHANAHHMATVAEPLAEASARIAAAGGGEITARKRL